MLNRTIPLIIVTYHSRMIKGVNGHFYYTSDEAGENQSQVQQANSGGGSALAIGKGSAVVATKKS